MRLFRYQSESRLARWSEYLLLAFGFACMLWYGYHFVQGEVAQSWDSYKLDQAARGEDATLTGWLQSMVSGPTPAPAEEEAAAEPKTPRKRARRPQTGTVIAKVEIPRIKVSATVREGVDDATLDKAAGHVPETPLPGEGGNFAIAAHRDTHFRGLRNIRKGDLIKVKTPDGTYQYEVDSLKIVWPRNVEVLHPTKEPVITLVTCYPFNFVGHAPKRFIVRGRRIDDAEAGAAVTGNAKPPARPERS